VPVGFSEDLEIHDRWLCWQVGWVASRGGLLALVRGLSPHLTSGRDEERMAAAYLIADAADYRQRGDAPHFGGGFAPDRQPVPIDLVDEQPESGVPIGVGVLLPSPRPAPGLALDDDVQFTVYRPGRVRAERWYPLLAFAHRTDPVEGPDGSLIDPTVVVEQQAQALLAAEPARFDSVSTDSTGAVLRGSDLLFEPWLDGGEVNPPRASVRWEEPVHRVEFRIRAPAAADGQILSGGLRVFMGVVLIGEVGFRVSVRSSVGEHAPLGALPVRRYRQIFASYSHRDVEVVRAVAHIGSLIGDSYLIDTQVLRSGEQWEPRLAEVIEQADVFQLFWSHNAMQSTFVQSEWEHALALGRDGFVHPVYWEEPLPADPARGLPPKSLGKLHFSRLGAEPAPVAGPLSQGFTPGPPSAAGPPPSPPPPPPPPPAGASPTTPPPSPAASPPAPPPPPSATPAADSTVRAPQMDDEYAGAPSDVAAQPGYAPGNWRSGYPAASRPPAPRSSRRLLGIAALVATLVVLVVLLALIL
jgi:hypothetical protein